MQQEVWVRMTELHVLPHIFHSILTLQTSDIFIWSTQTADRRTVITAHSPAAFWPIFSTHQKFLLDSDVFFLAWNFYLKRFISSRCYSLHLVWIVQRLALSSGNRLRLHLKYSLSAVNIVPKSLHLHELHEHNKLRTLQTLPNYTKQNTFCEGLIKKCGITAFA